MPFITYSFDSKTSVALTVDKQGRIYLNAALQRKLGCEGKEIELYVSYEPETRRIGIAKECPGKNVPAKFDKDRSYAICRDFLNLHDIEYRQGAVKYFYDGMVSGVMAFKSTQDYTDPIRTVLRQEKNGNLERMNA